MLCNCTALQIKYWKKNIRHAVIWNIDGCCWLLVVVATSGTNMFLQHSYIGIYWLHQLRMDYNGRFNYAAVQLSSWTIIHRTWTDERKKTPDFFSNKVKSDILRKLFSGHKNFSAHKLKSDADKLFSLKLFLVRAFINIIKFDWK